MLFYMDEIKVLLVDDDPEEFEVFCEVLKHYNNVSCKQVIDFSDSQKILKEEKPDIIFLDFNLPGTNGYEYLKKIKSDPNTKHIIIYMFSASEVGYLKNKCVEAGAEKWINKPKEIAEYYKVFDDIFTRDR